MFVVYIPVFFFFFQKINSKSFTLHFLYQYIRRASCPDVAEIRDPQALEETWKRGVGTCETWGSHPPETIADDTEGRYMYMQ